jgi:catechol 2,3-dioxygenase-like lactoylglutathione lyase family enzyme
MTKERGSPLLGARLVGFATTTDPARCRAFYEGKLGFRLAIEDQYALVFEANDSMIRIQKMKTHSPQPFTILGWNVSEIGATVDALENAQIACEQYGFPFQDQRGIATFPNGDKVAWLKDPDGNTLSIAQISGW